MLISFNKVHPAKSGNDDIVWLDICIVSSKSNAMKRKYGFILLTLLLLMAAPLKADIYFGEEPISIYPNPAVDYVKIDFHSDNSLVPQIKFYDLTGKVVREFDSEFILNQDVFKANLDISDMESGIYFVKVIQGEHVFTKKLVIK